MLPRKVAYLVLRERFGITWDAVGITMGGRDHSTILDGVKSIRAVMARDAELAAKVRELIAVGQRVAFDAHVIAWAIEQNAKRVAKLDAERKIVPVDSLEAARQRRNARVKAKNAMPEDDCDGLARMAGSQGLSAAIAAAGGWR